MRTVLFFDSKESPDYNFFKLPLQSGGPAASATFPYKHVALFPPRLV